MLSECDLLRSCCDGHDDLCSRRIAGSWILKTAIAHDRDPKVLADSLAKIDALLVDSAKDPDAHYARAGCVAHRQGRRRGRRDDKALALDPSSRCRVQRVSCWAR